MSVIVVGGRKNEAVCPSCGAPVDGQPRRPRARAFWIGVVIVAALMAVTFGFMVLAVSATAKHEAATSTAGLVSRAEFSINVRDKTMDQVRALLGPPTYTQSGGARSYWYYDRRTYDFETGKPDRSAQVAFEYLTVESVNFR